MTGSHPHTDSSGKSSPDQPKIYALLDREAFASAMRKQQRSRHSVAAVVSRHWVVPGVVHPYSTYQAQLILAPTKATSLTELSGVSEVAAIVSR